MAESRFALVTGAESGIGKAAALALAADHDGIIVGWHRSADDAAGVCEQIRRLGAGAESIYFDFADQPATLDTAARSLTVWGPISTLVNNAAMPYSAPFADTDARSLDVVMQVNFQAHVGIAQVVVAAMIESGIPGVVINVSSVQSQRAHAGSMAYSCAKGALDAFTRVAALELGQSGIRVVSIAPGEIVTPMTDLEGSAADQLHRPTTPLRRPGCAREVGSTIRFLASNDASYLTGITLQCDGGLSITMAEP